jgi:bacillopeptidase F
VVAGLQTAAQQSQAGALAVLAEREAAGGAANVRSFWIFDGLAANADLDTVLALAARPEVRLVRQERTIHLADDRTSQTTQPVGASAPQSQGAGWNITQIRADLVWSALRVDGSGVVVASIDTGVDLLHPALLTRYRGYDPHGLYQNTCNWFDATEVGAT